MKIYMKVSGSITKKMAEVSRFTPTVPGTMAGGRMESIVVLED